MRQGAGSDLALSFVVLAATACGAPPATTGLRPGATSVASPGAFAAAPGGFTASTPWAVERVVDGDTVVLEGGTRVRVLGIDAPELEHDSAVVRALAQGARTELARLLAGRSVVLLVGMPATDKYGRTLAYVERVAIGKGAPLDVGAALLASGHAQVFPAAHPRQEAYRKLQREARDAGRGLWAPDGRNALGLVVELETDAAGAANHVGRHVRATDVVRRVTRTPKGLFAELGPAPGLRLVVFPSQLSLFPDDVAARWRGSRLAVTGTVAIYRDRAEIVIDDPEQVQVLEP